MRVENGEAFAGGIDHPHPARHRNPFRRAPAQTRKFAHLDALRQLAQQRIDSLPVEETLDGVEKAQPRGASTPPRRRARIDDDPAADGAQRLRIAGNERIARRSAHRRIEHELHARAAAGLERLRLERNHPRNLVRSPEMNVQRRGVRQRIACGNAMQPHVDPGARSQGARIGQPVAARERRLVDAREIQGATLARQSDPGVAMLRMDAAHPHQRARRHQRERIADLHPACPRGAGRHRPPARHGKDAIDREAKQTVLGPLRPVRPPPTANARARRRCRRHRAPWP